MRRDGGRRMRHPLGSEGKEKYEKGEWRVVEEDEREITNSKHLPSLLKPARRELDENLTAKFHFSATFNSNQF